MAPRGTAAVAVARQKLPPKAISPSPPAGMAWELGRALPGLGASPLEGGHQTATEQKQGQNRDGQKGDKLSFQPRMHRGHQGRGPGAHAEEHDNEGGGEKFGHHESGADHEPGDDGIHTRSAPAGNGAGIAHAAERKSGWNPIYYRYGKRSCLRCLQIEKDAPSFFHNQATRQGIPA